MGFFLGTSIIVLSIANICRERQHRLLYGLGLPLGACCILMQIVAS